MRQFRNSLLIINVTACALCFTLIYKLTQENFETKIKMKDDDTTRPLLTWFGDPGNFRTWAVKGPIRGFHNLKITPDPIDGVDTVLAVKYPANSYIRAYEGGGVSMDIHPFGDTLATCATFEYDVLFPADFDFVIGGKLPGLYGGKQTCNGGNSGNGCFSARFMWGPYPIGFPYLYLPKDGPHEREFCKMNYNDTCAPAYGFEIAKTKYFERNKWIHIMQFIRLNTPNITDGVLTVWIDDVVKFHYEKMLWRTTGDVLIDGIFFHTFYGGATQDWAPKTDMYAYFKNLKYTVYSLS